MDKPMPSANSVKTKVKSKVKSKTKSLATKAAKAPEVSSAKRSLKRAVSSTQRAVKEHPVAAGLGTLLGAGVLVGVAANAIRRSSPSMGDQMVEAIGARASKVSKAAAKGLKRATSSVRRAMK